MIRSSFSLVILLLLIPVADVRADKSPGGSPLEVGSRRELFVDRYLIDRMDGTSLRLQTPRDEGIVLQLDQPHEGPFCGYTTIIRDDDRFRLYYRGLPIAGSDGSDNERTCYAESQDGIHWARPELGLFEFNGNTANNILLADAAPITHNFSPLLDMNPDAPPEERFKALGGVGKGLFALASPDGIHWTKMQDEPVITSANVPFEHRHLFDSQNLAFWSESEHCYVCYFRVWDGIRRIARTTSQDFREWSPAVLMRQVHDDGVNGPGPAPEEHLYTNQTSPYFRAPHIYLSTSARFFPGRQVVNEVQALSLGVNPGYFKDTSDSVFMTSRGGDVYDRTFPEGFLKPGIGPGNWVSRSNYPALNIVQTGPAEMSFYVNQNYAQPTIHLRRYSLRLDGFASMHAGATEGEFVTNPIVYSGKRLDINFATSAGGSVRFELQDPDGQPLPGFALTDSEELIGNEISRTVQWNGSNDLSRHAGRAVRLRCQLKDADLFAIRFADDDQ